MSKGKGKSGKFFDFDRQFSEMRHDTVTLHVFSKDYTIPARIPAIVPLEMSRLEDADGVPSKVMIKISRVMFGDTVLDEWAAHADFTIDRLFEITTATFKLINGEDPDDEPEEVTEDSAGGSPNV